MVHICFFIFFISDESGNGLDFRMVHYLMKICGIWNMTHDGNCDTFEQQKREILEQEKMDSFADVRLHMISTYNVTYKYINL